MDRDEWEISDHWRRGSHARDVQEEWIWRTIDHPDRAARQPNAREPWRDRQVYWKAIIEANGRYLRVVTEEDQVPKIVLTAHFDRARGRRRIVRHRRR